MDIIRFFEGLEIFVTGGSGIVGSALVETLLRSCNVKRIYLLLRPKKNSDAETRLKEIVKGKVFRELRKKKPEEINKLVAVPGDAVLPNLGIVQEYADKMANVSVVFHCAATIRFDEPLQYAMRLNVGGTLEALRFAETLRNLTIFMHVSTFFSNPYLKYVENKIYPSPMDWRVGMKLIEKSDDEINAITRKLIIGFPNTYTFTKNLAESLVNEWRERLPVAIYRPSVVLSAFNQPEPGFLPTAVGATGLFVAVSAGILKNVYCSSNVLLDITPLDLGISTMLYFTEKMAKRFMQSSEKPKEAPVRLFSSRALNTFEFKRLSKHCEMSDIWEECAFDKQVLIPSAVCTSNRFNYMFMVMFQQVLPALLIDALLKLSGRQGVLMHLARKIFISLEVMKPFLWNNYETDGVADFDAMVTAFDGTDFDVRAHTQISYTLTYVTRHMRQNLKAYRKLFVNESPETLPRAIKVTKAKTVIYTIIRAILLFYFLRWAYRMVLNAFFD